MGQNMAEASASPSATHSKALQAGLQLVAKHLSATSLDALAEAIAKDDSQVSRIRSGQLGACINDVVRLLYAAGLKTVPLDRVCVDRARYEAMVTMASAAMADEQTVRRLTWDE